jgi:hypothetical protein
MRWWNRSGQNVAPSTSIMGRERYAIPTLRLAGDGKYRIDRRLGARLGSGRYDAGFYRLVPVKRPASRVAPEMVNVIPEQATASVAPVSNCRLDSFVNGEYQPEYTTICGPNNSRLR